MESEKEARVKVEKQRRQLNDELENLRDTLEESESSTAAQQEIRTKRENELAQLKKTLEDEASSHESAVGALRHKHNKAMDDLNEQMESLKKVRTTSSLSSFFLTSISFLDFFCFFQPIFFNFPHPFYITLSLLHLKNFFLRLFPPFFFVPSSQPSFPPPLFPSPCLSLPHFSFLPFHE